MNREVLSVVGAVTVVLILVILRYVGVITLSDMSAALASILIGSIFSILLWGFAPRIRQFGIGKTDENVIMPAPSQGRHWFSRLRRSPIKKEKRADFWLTVITMVIVGTVIIAIALSFQSTSIPPEAAFTFLTIRITMVGTGIVMIMLSAWFTITQLYGEWESRKQLIVNRRTTYLNILNDFDNSLRDLKQTSSPKTKDMMLVEFQYRLRNLCNLPWNDEVSKRITQVLEYIPEKLSEDPHVNYYLQFLGMIIYFYGEHKITMIKGKFLVELENLYNTAKFDNILSMLQKLHEHSEEYTMKLVNDAGSTNVWSDSRFDSSMRSIEFWELRSRNQEAYNRVLQYLRQKMDDAERNNDEKTHDRFKKLWESAKGS